MISIIIPTKDEPYIQKVVNGIRKYVKSRKEIIIIDESKIKPKVRGAKVYRQRSHGLGNAFKEGLRKAKGNVIVLIDGDGSHNPKYLPGMIHKLEDHDIVLGSKLVRGGGTEDDISRQFVTLGFSILTNLILWVGIRDPMTGYAVFKKSVFRKVKLNPRGFKIVLETVYKSKAKVYEYPIVFRKRRAGKTKVGWSLKGVQEAFRILFRLFALRFGMN